jgi:hypothetical protein
MISKYYENQFTKDTGSKARRNFKSFQLSMFRSANSRNAPKQQTYRARTLPLGLKVGTFGTRSIRTIRNAIETLRATLTFSVLLGLGSVTLADVFPGSVGMSAADALLGLLIYYLRVVLFVMILSQYFMATLGAEFSRLKWLGRVLHARSVGADVAADIAPEVQLRMQHLARRVARCRTGAAVAPADAVQSVAGSQTSTDSTSSSREALQLIRGCMKHLDSSSSNDEETTGSQAVIQVLGMQLDLPALQQLLLQLTEDSQDIQSQLRLQRSAAGSATAQPVDDGQVEAAAAPGVRAAEAECAAAVAAVAVQLLGTLQGVSSSDCAREDPPIDQQEVRGISKQ